MSIHTTESGIVAIPGSISTYYNYDCGEVVVSGDTYSRVGNRDIIMFAVRGTPRTIPANIIGRIPMRGSVVLREAAPPAIYSFSTPYIVAIGAAIHRFYFSENTHEIKEVGKLDISGVITLKKWVVSNTAVLNMSTWETADLPCGDFREMIHESGVLIAYDGADVYLLTLTSYSAKLARYPKCQYRLLPTDNGAKLLIYNKVTFAEMILGTTPYILTKGNGIELDLYFTKLTIPSLPGKLTMRVDKDKVYLSYTLKGESYTGFTGNTLVVNEFVSDVCEKFIAGVPTVTAETAETPVGFTLKLSVNLGGSVTIAMKKTIGYEFCEEYRLGIPYFVLKYGGKTYVTKNNYVTNIVKLQRGPVEVEQKNGQLMVFIDGEYKLLMNEESKSLHDSDPSTADFEEYSLAPTSTAAKPTPQFPPRSCFSLETKNGNIVFTYTEMGKNSATPARILSYTCVFSAFQYGMFNAVVKEEPGVLVSVEEDGDAVIVYINDPDCGEWEYRLT